MLWINTLHPIIISFGSFALHWYGVMYALAFTCGYFYLRVLIRRRQLALTEDALETLLFSIVLGVVLGGRIGHFVLYDIETLLHHPLEFLYVWHGGMSFHGGLIGVLVALGWFTRRYRIHFLALTDVLVVPVALGLALGRVGNFINGELWGRPTDGTWGVIFPRAGDAVPRHPAQLYAVSKDLLIAALLLLVGTRKTPTGTRSFAFLVLYGAFRTMVELAWREPLDGVWFGWLPVGAGYSIPLIVIGLGGLVWAWRRTRSSLAVCW